MNRVDKDLPLKLQSKCLIKFYSGVENLVFKISVHHMSYTFWKCERFVDSRYSGRPAGHEDRITVG